MCGKRPTFKHRKKTIIAMQVDVGAQVVRLLYEHDTVVIPGLGGLETTYQEANIDHIQGKLDPPSKSIAFNPNLVVDDGLLVDRVQKKYALPVHEAQEAVQAFVTAIKTKLDQRDIVEIDDLGRLYVDYEGTIKLLPDTVNFNTAVFGLPSISAQPILRSRPAAATAATAAPAATATTASDVSENISNWFQRLLPVFIILTVLIIGFGAYLIFFNDDATETEATADVPTSRVNIKPSTTDSATAEEPAIAKEDDPALESEEEPNEQPSSVTEDSSATDTEGATVRPDQAYAIIAVGLFGNKNNVKKMIRKIYKEGYEPYTQEEGKNTRVAVVITFEDESDFQRQFREIKNTFDKNSKILKKVEE
jgi:cell division septation protein DedD